MWIGVDYGSKMAGTTVACWLSPDSQRLCWAQSIVKQDADVFVMTVIEKLGVQQVFLDAPLSLPGFYQGLNTSFHFRAGDKELGAMSPMFLGGLTARAMQLSHILSENGCACLEVYPGAWVRKQTTLLSYYQKKQKETQPFVDAMLSTFSLPQFAQMPSNWHQVDAIIAWWIGHQYNKGAAQCYGDSQEGLVWI